MSHINKSGFSFCWKSETLTKATIQYFLTSWLLPVVMALATQPTVFHWTFVCSSFCDKWVYTALCNYHSYPVEILLFLSFYHFVYEERPRWPTLHRWQVASLGLDYEFIRIQSPYSQIIINAATPLVWTSFCDMSMILFLTPAHRGWINVFKNHSVIFIGYYMENKSIEPCRENLSPLVA